MLVCLTHPDVISFTYLLTSCMEQDLSRNANSFLAKHEIASLCGTIIFINVFTRYHPAPTPDQPKSNPCSPFHFPKIHFNINLSSISWSSNGYSSPFSPSIICMHFSSTPYVLHDPHKTFFLILSTEKYLVIYTDH